MVRAMSRHGEDEGERAAGGGRGPGVSFGFETVAESEKAPRVRRVFESVAGRYDLMNDLMSGGVHRMWKQAFVDWLAPGPGQGLLDVAGGTGDIAFRVIERVGRARVGAIVAGDAEALPVAESSVEAYTIAFGLRNVTHIEGALAEARRVLKPGGRFLCLEFSQVVVPLVDRLYDLYSFKVLPALGEAVTGDRDAYQYLVESIRRFPPQDELAAMMEAAGLERVSYRNLSGGIAAMHSAWRI
jgi:demethylmenaquinone methyltransferase/2-methoxy-6-polyprenyl-1,4-benzoquinol methylase